MSCTRGGGGGLSGDNFDGDNFGSGKFRKGKISPAPGILKLAVIFWWALDGSPNFLQSTFKILGNTAFQCIPVTQPPHVAKKHIFLPSLRLVHWCTLLNSQHSPASEFAVKLLVTHCENFAGGEKFRHFSQRRSLPAKFCPPEIFPSHVSSPGCRKSAFTERMSLMGLNSSKLGEHW